VTRALAIVALLAQGPPLSTLRHIYVQQQQVDALQARLDGSFVPAIVALNPPAMNPSGALEVSGWAFRCGEEDGGRLVVLIDGVQSVQADERPLPEKRHIPRQPRPDVANQANSTFCVLQGSYVPTNNAGFWTLVDVSAYSLGWNGNGCHTVKVRLYDLGGRMKESIEQPMCW
jgi:hypothetical protein